jgi:hypothetical protein
VSEAAVSFAEGFRYPPTIARALASRAKIVGIFGPARCGKTAGACMYVWRHIKKYAAQLPGHVIKWVFVRNTYESLQKTTLQSWLTWFPAPTFGRYLEAKKTYLVRLPKGQRGEVLFMGLDEERDLQSLLSLDLSGFVIDEPAGGVGTGGIVKPGIPEQVYLGLIPRLSHPIALQRTRGIVIGNPPSTAHWAARHLKQAALEEPERVACVDAPASEAPILRHQPNFYTDMIHALGGPQTPDARRYAMGEWLEVLTGQLNWRMVDVIEPAELPAFAAIGATCDPAAGGKSGQGDRTAIVVAGFTFPDARAVILDLQVGRFEFGEIVQRLYALQARTWQGQRIGKIGVENVGFQRWLAVQIDQEYEQRRGRGEAVERIPLLQLPRDPRVAKESRIAGTLGNRLAERRLGILSTCAHQDEFQRELESFPDGAHDDILDAVADLDQIAALARPAVDVGSAPADRAPSPGTYRNRRDELPEIAPQSFWRGRGTARFWGRGAA